VTTDQPPSTARATPRPHRAGTRLQLPPVPVSVWFAPPTDALAREGSAPAAHLAGGLPGWALNRLRQTLATTGRDIPQTAIRHLMAADDAADHPAAGPDTRTRPACADLVVLHTAPATALPSVLAMPEEPVARATLPSLMNAGRDLLTPQRGMLAVHLGPATPSQARSAGTGSGSTAGDWVAAAAAAGLVYLQHIVLVCVPITQLPGVRSIADTTSPPSASTTGRAPTSAGGSPAGPAHESSADAGTHPVVHHDLLVFAQLGPYLYGSSHA
jgi:hypothetical protein